MGTCLHHFGRHADVTEWKVLAIFPLHGDVTSVVFTYSKIEKNNNKMARFICPQVNFIIKTPAL